jgi:pullulanase/glycogen debranching enzyme
LYLSTNESIDRIARMQRQANAIILTSQGIPFLHAGVEILRTKPCVPGGETCDSEGLFDHNSYKSPDETNQVNWQWKVDHMQTFNYYQSLIRLRKEKSVFRLSTSVLIQKQLFLIPDTILGFVSYFLYDENDVMKTIYILHNNGNIARDINLQPGTWSVLGTTDSFASFENNSFIPLRQQMGDSNVTLQPNDTLIMYSTEIVRYFPIDDNPPNQEVPIDNNQPNQGTTFQWTFLINLIGIFVIGGGGLVYYFITKEKQTKNR